jgi:hypothetical protein
MTWPNQKVNDQSSDLPLPFAMVVESERIRQQNVLRAVRRDQEETVMVWTAAGTDYGTRRGFASIAATRWLNPDNYSSGLSNESAPMGILGDFEKHIDDVVFIRPFWIWTEPHRT